MFLEVGLLIQETERARMKRILNYKYMILFGIIAFITMFMVFYVYINYAYEMPSRYENVNYDETDLTREEIEKIRNNNFLQNFLSLKEGFSFDESYSRYCAVKTRIIPIVVISIFFLYSSIKCNLVKYNIGRNNKFAKENNKLKRRIALIPALFSLIIVFALIVIGLLSNKNNFLTYFKFLYNHNDIISYVMFNNVAVLIVFEIFSFIGIYLLSLFSLELVDRYGNIDAIIIFLIISWVLPIFISGDLMIFTAIRKILPHFDTSQISSRIWYFSYGFNITNYNINNFNIMDKEINNMIKSKYKNICIILIKILFISASVISIYKTVGHKGERMGC